MSRPDLSNQLVVGRTSSQLFPGGANYPTVLGFHTINGILGKGLFNAGYIFRFWARLPRPDKTTFGSLDLSRQFGWPSAGFAGRLTD